MCHLCKMKIPKSYMGEHIESIIHKTNVKITKVALSRSKDQISNYIESKPSNNSASDEFCDVCNVTYHYLEYSTHQSTEQHKKLIVYERILPRMYQLFKNTGNNLQLIDEIDEIFKKYVGNTTKKARVEIGKTYCEICDVYKHTQGFDGHLKGKKHKNNCGQKNIPVTNVKKTAKKEEYCEVCNVFKSADGFHLHLQSRKHQKKARKLEKNSSEVEVKGEDTEEDKQKLTRDHHKYLTESGNISLIDDGKLKRCTICKTNFSGEDDEFKEHLVKDEHFAVYKDILIGNKIIKLAKEYFCEKCDTFVSNIVEHIQQKHYSFSIFSNNTTRCNLCQCNIPSGGKGVHEAGAKHKENERKRRIEKIKFIDIEISDEIDRKSLTIVNNELICVICKVILHDKDMIDRHFSGVKHEFEFLRYSSDNGIVTEHEVFNCKKCEVPVPKNEILEHVKSSTHKWKYSIGGHL